MKRTRPNRNERGQLADSAVGVWLVITGIVGGTLILVNVGGYLFYRIKLGFIANQAAIYGCGLPTNSLRNSVITAYANQNMVRLGFNPSRTTVAISDTTINSRPAIKITVTSALKNMVPMDGIVPPAITLSDSAVAAQRYWYFGDTQFLNPYGGHCTFPLVNSTGEVPNDGLPVWQISLTASNPVRERN